MTSEAPRVEAMRLIEAGAFFWPHDRHAAIRMAKQGVSESSRPPERQRLLLAELDLAAESLAQRS